MSYSLIPTPRGLPRLYAVHGELAIEGKAVYNAPVVTPAVPTVRVLSTEALIRLLAR